MITVGASSGWLSNLFKSTTVMPGGINMISSGGGIVGKMFGTAKPATAVATAGAAKGGSIVLPVVGGGLAGFGFASIFGGGSKKEATLTAAPQSMNPVITPTQVITPVITQPSYIYTNYYQQDYSRNTVTDSPFAGITKKTGAGTEAAPLWSTPITGSQDVPFTGSQGQELSASQSDGTNMALLAGIAAVGLIGYGYVSRKKTS